MSLSRRFLRRLDCGLASGCALDCHGGREGLFWNIGRTKHRARSLPNIQEKQEPFLTPLSLQVVPLNSWGLGGSLLLLKSLAASTSAPLVLETFFKRTADNYKWANLDESFRLAAKLTNRCERSSRTQKPISGRYPHVWKEKSTRERLLFSAPTPNPSSPLPDKSSQVHKSKEGSSNNGGADQHAGVGIKAARIKRSDQDPDQKWDTAGTDPRSRSTSRTWLKPTEAKPS